MLVYVNRLGFGLGDLVSNKQLTGNILKDVSGSITYFFTNVLVYWWAVILIGGVVLAVVTTIGCKNLITFQKDRHNDPSMQEDVK